jgi:uncharacterized protein (TIGR00251 family)
MITITVKVVPGSSRDRIAGKYGDALKVQVSAAPEKGKANAAVAKLLAGFFGVKPSEVALFRGAANPRKQFRISGLSPEVFAAKMAGFR